MRFLASGRRIYRSEVHLAQVAELVDALDSGSSTGDSVEVRVLSWAHEVESKAR